MRPSFYPLQDFPKLRHLADQWQIMRDELLRLSAPLLDINRVGKGYDQVYSEISEHMARGGQYGWLKGWDNYDKENPDWIQYGLVMGDEPIPFALDSMPATMGLLSEVKGIKVCGLARMRPHTFLSTHRHPEIHDEGLLQFHITLEAPRERNYAYLNVNGAFNQNVLGDAVVFDGSLDHFALNASEEARTILYMEFKKDALMRA